MDSSMIEPVILATGAVLQSEFGDSARRFHEEGFTVRPVPCDLQIEKGVDAAMAIGRAPGSWAQARSEFICLTYLLTLLTYTGH